MALGQQFANRTVALGQHGAVARRAAGQRDVLSALYLDRQRFLSEIRKAFRRAVLPGIVGIQLFQEQVLGIEIGRRQPPGEPVVSAGQNKRRSRQGAADQVAGFLPFLPAQMGEIERAGRRQAQMRIVGQQRLAGDGLRAGNRPVVGSRQLQRPGRGGLCRFLDRLGARRLVETVQRLQIGQHRRIVPFVRRVDFLDLAGGKPAAGQRQPSDFLVHVGIERQRHHFQQRDRLPGLPRFGLVAKDDELDGKRRFELSGLAGDPGVDPFHIGGDHGPVFGLQPLEGGFRSRCNAQRPEKSVGGNRIRPEHFRQPALPRHAQHFHLPQPLACMCPTERAHRVKPALRLDMGNGVLILDDRHGCRKPGDRRFALGRRHRIAQQPVGACQHRRHQNEQRKRSETQPAKQPFHVSALSRISRATLPPPPGNGKLRQAQITGCTDP